MIRSYFVYYGINISRMEEKKTLELPISKYLSPHRMKIIYVGALDSLLEDTVDKIKGTITLIKAIPLVLREFPTASFFFAGEGPRNVKEVYEELIKRLGLSNNVFFLGVVQDDSVLNSLYDVADVVVIPSLYESFNIVSLEARALQKPIICSAVGGLNEVVDDGVDGIKFTPEDHRELAEKIIFLLKNPKIAKKLGKNGRDKVLQKFSISRAADETLEVYEKAIEEYVSD